MDFDTNNNDFTILPNEFWFWMTKVSLHKTHAITLSKIIKVYVVSMSFERYLAEQRNRLRRIAFDKNQTSCRKASYVRLISLNSFLRKLKFCMQRQYM